MALKKDTKKDTKKDFINNKAMFAYGVIQLGAKVVSAVALVAIALGFCALKKESNFFNECVEEIKATSSPTADSVRFCTGG
jgi:preprotein translocase subunit SecE